MWRPWGDDVMEREGKVMVVCVLMGRFLWEKVKPLGNRRWRAVIVVVVVVNGQLEHPARERGPIHLTLSP